MDFAAALGALETVGERDAQGYFPINVGLMTRGPTRRALKVMAAQHGVELRIDEDRGLLGSLLECRLTGRADRMVGFIRECEAWLRENGAEV